MSDQTPAELREAFESLQKEQKKLQKQNESLAAENRKLQAKEAFREADLPANLADLFVAANPDAEISVDSVSEFAQTYGITGGTAPEGDGGDEGDEGAAPAGEGGQDPDGTKGLSNFARAGSGEGGGGQPPSSDKILTRDEFLSLQRENPAAANQALAEGRVRVRNDNPYATGAVPTVGRNPFTHGESDDE